MYENEKKSFDLLAEVVRVSELKKQWLFHIGVSFCKIEEECRELIAKYIKNYSDKKFESIDCLAKI